MKDKTLNIFDLLNKNKIKYFLLRPLDFAKGFNDIDLVVEKSDLKKLINCLIKDNYQVSFKFTNYNESIKLFVDNIVLDIQFYICFLPHKSLVIKKSIPYSFVKIVDDQLLFPSSSDEIMFTFWTFRLFLDKKDIDNTSTSFQIYKEIYKTEWEKLVKTKFFKVWIIIVFGNQHENIFTLIKYFFKNNMTLPKNISNKDFRKAVLRKSIYIYIKYSYDQVKYRILRRLGRYNNFRNVNSLINKA